MNLFNNTEKRSVESKDRHDFSRELPVLFRIAAFAGDNLKSMKQKHKTEKWSHLEF